MMGAPGEAAGCKLRLRCLQVQHINRRNSARNTFFTSKLRFSERGRHAQCGAPTARVCAPAPGGAPTRAREKQYTKRQNFGPFRPLPVPRRTPGVAYVAGAGSRFPLPRRHGGAVSWGSRHEAHRPLPRRPPSAPPPATGVAPSRGAATKPRTSQARTAPVKACPEEPAASLPRARRRPVAHHPRASERCVLAFFPPIGYMIPSRHQDRTICFSPSQR